MGHGLIGLRVGGELCLARWLRATYDKSSRHRYLMQLASCADRVCFGIVICGLAVWHHVRVYERVRLEGYFVLFVSRFVPYVASSPSGLAAGLA